MSASLIDSNFPARPLEDPQIAILYCNNMASYIWMKEEKLLGKRNPAMGNSTFSPQTNHNFHFIEPYTQLATTYMSNKLEN